MVTGGCGFVGAHLVRRLAREGASRVVVVDDLRHGAATVLAGVDVELVTHALGTDPHPDLERAMRGIDCVLHLAAEKHNISKQDPARIARANVDGTRSVVQAALTCGVRKIVFASSLYVYGRDRGAPFAEREPLEPTTAYGKSKLEGERLVATFSGESCALRYMFVYGPRLAGAIAERSLIASTFARLVANEPPIVFGDGRQSLDFVFVDDVVEATLVAMRESATGAYNVGSGVATPVRDLVARMSRIAGSSASPVFAPADETANTSRVASVAKFAEAFGWRATTSLDDGLALCFRHQRLRR